MRLPSSYATADGNRGRGTRLTAMMTRQEFEQAYADMSGVTVAAVHALGRYAKRCQCDYEHCQGWQMARVAEYDEYAAYDGWIPFMFRPAPCESRCDNDCELGPVHCKWAHEPNHKDGWHSPDECPVFGPA